VISDDESMKGSGLRHDPASHPRMGKIGGPGVPLPPRGLRASGLDRARYDRSEMSSPADETRLPTCPPAQVAFSGLVSLDSGGARRSIYWVRLFRRAAGETLVIVTEVPGNPGASVSNAANLHHDLIQEHELSPGESEFIHHYPRGAFGDDPGSYYRHRLGSQVAEETSRSELEAELGIPLPSLPTHATLLASVQKLGGGTTRELLRDKYEAIPVEALPAPHAPHECAYRHLFAEAQTTLSASLPRETGERQAGEAFLRRLRDVDRSRCRYHRANWLTIADVAARIVDALGVADREAYLEEVKRSGIQGKDRFWLESLFEDPIVVTGGRYSNGQHRACALRFSGSARAVVVTDTEKLGEEPDDWVMISED
jgi:hypothetical protein